METQQFTNEVAKRMAINTKDMLTTEEAAQYLGMHKGSLHRLMCEKKIPYYKPMGKLCYFSRTEIEQWMRGNRITPNDEIREQAINYCKKGGKR